jgi:hypothetical protein
MSQDAVDVLVAEHGELQSLFGRVSSPDEDRPAIPNQLVVKLSARVSMKKQFLIPVIKDRVVGGDEPAKGLTDYHDKVERNLVLLDRRKVNSPDVPELVTQFLDLTEGHVAEADTTLIPGLRAPLSADELGALGEAMVSDERQLLTHPHPHLPDSGPIGEAARSAASLVDGRRDESTDVNRSGT